MSVYVDDMYKTELGNFGRMKMSHMFADSKEELLEMARKISVPKKWIQHENTDREHFDICLSKRKLAISFGAIEISMRDAATRSWSTKNDASNI